jgi:hypothetical protein
LNAEEGPRRARLRGYDLAASSEDSCADTKDEGIIGIAAYLMTGLSATPPMVLGGGADAVSGRL